MKLKFLCAQHRSWLQQNPFAALTTCMGAYEEGLDLAEECNFSRAASHAGCALEAAQILMESSSSYSERHLELYSNSGELLIRALLRLREVTLASNIHDGVLLFLEDLLVRGTMRTEVLSCSSKWLRLREELELLPHFELRSTGAASSIQLH